MGRTSPNLVRLVQTPPLGFASSGHGNSRFDVGVAPRLAAGFDSDTRRLAKWKELLLLRLDTPFVELCRRIWSEIEADNCVDWAAQMSFYFVAALFPFFIFIAALVGFLPFSGFWHSFVVWTTHYLPRGARRMVVSEVLGLTRGRVSFLSIGVLGTAWTASTGIMSLMESLNAAYDVRETRSYWQRRGLALRVLLVLSLLILTAFAILSAGHWVGVWLSAHADSPYLYALWNFGRWLVSLGFLGMAAAITDHVLPDRKRAWRWVTPGSIFTIFASMLASVGFNLYVEYVSPYSKTYGALGALVILMIWIYVMSLIVLIGAEVNHDVESRRSVAQPSRPVSRPLKSQPAHRHAGSILLLSVLAGGALGSRLEAQQSQLNLSYEGQPVAFVDLVAHCFGRRGNQLRGTQNANRSEVPTGGAVPNRVGGNRALCRVTRSVASRTAGLM